MMDPHKENFITVQCRVKGSYASSRDVRPAECRTTEVGREYALATGRFGAAEFQ